MRKTLKMALISVFSMLLLPTLVNAKVNSRIINGHQMVPGTTFYQGPTVELTTPTYDSVYGAYVGMQLVYKESLPQYLASDNSRQAYFDIYEYDVYPNEDDKVVAYRANFSGRTIQSVYVQSRYISGNDVVDSVGDKTAELYVKARLLKVNDDTVQSSGQFYTYQIFIS